MARAVVLYFEDNQYADNFLEAMKEETVVIDERQYPDSPVDHITDYASVQLVVAVPTQFCEGGHKKGKFSMAYTRGLKWGWWVCVHCKKPSGVGGFMKTLRSCLSQSKQLLPDASEDVAAVTDEGWGALSRG